jgi:Mrp family chromosome partitioning ATPase
MLAVISLCLGFSLLSGVGLLRAASTTPLALVQRIELTQHKPRRVVHTLSPERALQLAHLLEALALSLLGAVAIVLLRRHAGTLSPVAEAVAVESAPGLAETIAAIEDAGSPPSARPSTLRPARSRSARPESHRAPALHPSVRNRIIYYVGARETPAPQAVLSPRTLHHLDDLAQRLHADPDAPRVIRIASDQAGRRAKSHIAVQLAAALAERHGARVLLLEADLDAPALHSALRFRAPAGYGLSEQLQRLAEPTADHSVSIVRLTERMHALVEGAPSTQYGAWRVLFADLLTRQRREYDYILVDGPILGTGTDVEHLDEVDAILLAVGGGASLARTFELAGQGTAGAPLLRIIDVSAAAA